MTDIKSIDEQALRKVVLSQGEAIVRLINQLEAQEAYVARIDELEEAIREFLRIEGTKDYSSGYDVMYDMGISLLRKTIGMVPEDK